MSDRQVMSLLRRYLALSATAVVGAAVVALLLVGAAGPARWMASAFALAIAAYTSIGMVRDVLRGHWGIDILAVTAVVSTVVVGEYGAALIIVLMMTGGEALETYAAGRAKGELTALLDRAPQTAHRLTGVGDEVEDIPIDEVEVDDKLLVRPAEVVPVDGVLLSQGALFDESSLTGESLPVEHLINDTVLSGAVNEHTAVRIRASARAADSQYGQIVALVREASRSRAPMVRLADRYAVPFTALAYLIAGTAWLMSGDASRFAEVLVVATPCPLLIAAPVAFLGGMSRAARGGIIVKGGSVVETLSRIRTAAFDKTGTLTHGRPTLVAVVPASEIDERELLTLTASAEQYSSHALAASIMDEARARGVVLRPADNASEEATNGVRALIDGRQVVVGKRRYIAGHVGEVPVAQMPAGQLAVYVAVDAAYAGALILADPLRENAPTVLERLRRLGVRHTMMLTGDAASTAHHVSGLLGLTDVRAECLPADKVAAIAGIDDRPVLMVGDGVNDAPALAAADVGVAMGAKGATAASESADVVIMLDDLAKVADAVAIGKRTTRVAVQSIWLGIVLSVGLMLLASVGFVPALVGALAQEVVDLAAIGNALRALTSGRRAEEQTNTHVNSTASSGTTSASSREVPSRSVHD